MPGKSRKPIDLIREEISHGGPLTFARFMGLALYDPECGYYASGKAKIGKGGDFYTNVSVGPVFGKILADQFLEMRALLGEPRNFTIVEQGANDGTLAADILAALPEELPIEYAIVEPSRALREQQAGRLQSCVRKIHWHESLEALPRFVGIHFSNELIDALPFHLVRSTGSGWEELFVADEGETLVFRGGPPGPVLEKEVSGLPSRPPGYVTELRPAAAEWIELLSARLERGFVLVSDYGFTRPQLLAPHRTEGTYSCYRGHQRDAKPLLDPGEKDITAHADFSSLADAALRCGLQLAGFTDQHHFLVGASQKLLQSLAGPPDPARQKSLRALQTLLHPETMGTQFHYLAFSKETDSSQQLSGFQFARNGREKFFDPA